MRTCDASATSSGSTVSVPFYGSASEVVRRAHVLSRRWYRPPELLFGAPYHVETVDMWSVGCIFGEMLLRRVMFPGTGSNEEEVRVNQIAQIVRILGTPDEIKWKVRWLDLLGRPALPHPLPLASSGRRVLRWLRVFCVQGAREDGRRLS